MEDFKTLPKMKAFREGGHAKSEEYCGGGKMRKKEGGKIAHEDVAEDKKMIKKAFKQHDKAEHEGADASEIKLRKGGRSKKEKGTVTKYKAGGVANAPSKAAEKPAFRGSDVAKEKSKPAGEKDKIKKVPPTGDKKADAPSKGEVKGKVGKEEFFKRGGVKKFNVGGLSNPMMDGGALAAPSAFQAANNQFGPNAPTMPPVAPANPLQGGQPTAFRRGGKAKSC